MPAPITYGIIGTSWITSSWINCADATGKWKLNAVFSRSADTAASFAKKHGITKSYSKIGELAYDTEIQAVYIASPNSFHFGQARQMLDAGKHVILEKPACSTSLELAQLYEIAHEKGLFLIEAYRHIHEVNFKIAQQALHKIGAIYGASITFAQFSSRYKDVLSGETPNVFNLDLSGGHLADLGVYSISAAITLFGVPHKSTYKPYITSTGADGGGVILFEYPTFGVSINSSKIYTSSAPTEIYGEKGTLRLNACTDISSVEFLAPGAKQGQQLAKPKAELNLSEQADLYADIINRKDSKQAAELERLSKDVQAVTEDLRKQNDLTFGIEKNLAEQRR